MEEKYLEGKNINQNLSEETLNEIRKIQDCSLGNPKGRPKQYQRILSLYDKLKQLEKSQVKIFYFKTLNNICLV